MSAFIKLFGNGKLRRKNPTLPEAMQKLQEAEEMLKRKQDYFEKKIEQELANLKRCIPKSKRHALHALRRKKRHERELQEMDTILAKVEAIHASLSLASTNEDVLNSVMGEHAAKELVKNALPKQSKVQVHELMNEIAKEIAEAITNPMGYLGQDIEDDELLAELEVMEEEEELGASRDDLHRKGTLNRKGGSRVAC